MSLIDKEEVCEIAKQAQFNDQEYKGFARGIFYAEQKLTPLFVEFAEWCFRYDRQYRNHTKTTAELFALWCEEREGIVK